MTGASIEATLELWASSLREVKARMGPLLSQERVVESANSFLDGLLGDERRKRGGSENLNIGDKWIADLTAAMLAARRRQDEQATAPEP